VRLVQVPGGENRECVMIYITVDWENNAEAWWDAARVAADCPSFLRQLIHGGEDEIWVERAEADIVLAWA